MESYGLEVVPESTNYYLAQRNNRLDIDIQHKNKNVGKVLK